ncbi:hypothetical protein [Bacillus thuringiensis]|uniref:hypothetical protein n=1 Tax=Bacillus thuringiensis TaxID=1428 RepID=UPI000BFBD7E3|nr:hypothetical protein [Bacillus thuringiensis]PGS64061.1 hypothetical protein COD07_28550 [Bacillus thuringiensis]
MEITVEKLELSSIDKRLEHLSQEQIIDLMKKYYDGEKVANILEEYEIKISASQLYSIFPPVATEEECVYCGSVMVQPWESKSWSTYINSHKKYCIKCGHEDSQYCYCTHCKEIKEKAWLEEIERKKEIIERKKATIASFYDDKKWNLKPENELSLEDRLYLSMILRSSLSENTMYIEPLLDVKGNLAPTEDFEIELIKTLTGRKILVPHVISNINAFDVTYKEDDYLEIVYGIYKVNYRINIEPYDLDYDEMIKRLMYPSLDSNENYKEFCFDMWKKVALNECLQYLLYQMDKVGYSFNPGEKTIRVFEHLLEHFSVSQIYGIIYRAVANSTQRYQAGEITRIHAQNSVITSCESHGQRAIAQGWKLSHYSRIRDLPEAYISQVLYTSVMQIAELGFSEKPTINF